MDREELAWAAGFFDGEGSTGTYSKVGRRGSIHMTVGQDHLELLERFHRAVLGIGSIYGPYKNSKQRYWKAFGHEDVQAAGALLWSFLGPIKRAQWKTALKQWSDLPRVYKIRGA